MGTGSTGFSAFSGNWADSTSAIKKIGYNRKHGTLTLTRADWKTSSGAPSTLTYTIHEQASASDGAVATVTLTADATKSEGSSTATLNWGTTYYIKETTADYSGKDAAIHGPYTFGVTGAASGTADTTTWSLNRDTMTMSVAITPSLAQSVSFQYTNVAGAAASATFSVRDKATLATQTLTITSGTGSMTNLLTGHSYTVTQTGTATTTGGALLTYDMNVLATKAIEIVANSVRGGTVTSNGSTTSPVVTMSERMSELRLRMDICTAEQGYETYVDDDQEITHVDGVTFGVFASASTSTSLATATTDGDGYFVFQGLADGTYYVKCTNIPNGDAVTQLSSDKSAVFAVTLSNGTVSGLAVSGSSSSSSSNSSSSSTNPKMKVENGNIRAFLKKGSIKLTAKSDKTFYVYRLTWGSGTDDEREDRKMEGVVPDDLKNATKGDNFIAVAKAGAFLKQELERINSLFVLKAQAAESAKTITHAGYTWQLIGSKRPGNGSTGTFDGLISGQAYLIREGDSVDPGSSDQYYLVKKVSSSSSISSANASTAKSGSSTTAKSGASTANTSSGSGTGSKGGAAGARGSATGDGNDLWTHLIVMLIAFDALVADLLYISRKKQRVVNK